MRVSSTKAPVRASRDSLAGSSKSATACKRLTQRRARALDLLMIRSGSKTARMAIVVMKR